GAGRDSPTWAGSTAGRTRRGGATRRRESPGGDRAADRRRARTPARADPVRRRTRPPPRHRGCPAASEHPPQEALDQGVAPARIFLQSVTTSDAEPVAPRVVVVLQ